MHKYLLTNKHPGSVLITMCFVRYFIIPLDLHQADASGVRNKMTHKTMQMSTNFK